MFRTLRFVALVLAVGTPASAQQSRPTNDPQHAIDEAVRGEHPVLRHAEHHRGGAHDWSLPLATTRGTCYRLVGLAHGTSQVHVVINVRRSRVGDPLALASSTSELARARFCATLPGHVYSLAVHADGDADWALAVHPAPAEEPQPEPGAASREQLANALANSSSQSPSSAPDAGAAAQTATEFPIGGVEQDYVGGQIRALVSGRSVRAIHAAERVTLAENQTHEVALPLVGGHCIIATAASVPSVSDLVLEISDPSGNRVAQDTQRRGVDALSYCPPYSGTYRFVVRAFAGFGLTGIQTFEVH